MYKKFLLMFIIIINMSIYSQVVIKDEIILYETENPDEESLSMPFYGNAFIRFITPAQKMRAYFTVDGQTKFLNEISGATYNCSCGLPLWSMDVQWTFSEVPAARDVGLQALQCQQVSPTPPPSGPCDWVELPVEFNEDPQTEDKWNISVDVNYPNTPPDWRYSGYILFTETTPPGCDSANNNYCNSTTHHLPDWNLNIHYDDENYARAQACEDESASGTVTNIFVQDDKGKEWNYNDFNLNSFDACFNKDTQKWQFNFTNPQDFEMHWILDYCENVLAHYDVLNSIDDVNCERIPFFAWQFARNCFEKNKYWSGFDDGDYLIFEVLESHEQKHVEQLQGLFYSGLLAEFYQRTAEWELKNCASFNSYTEAKEKALAAIKEIFRDMQRKFVNKVSEFEISWEEIARRERIKIAQRYIDALVELICP